MKFDVVKGDMVPKGRTVFYKALHLDENIHFDGFEMLTVHLNDDMKNMQTMVEFTNHVHPREQFTFQTNWQTAICQLLEAKELTLKVKVLRILKKHLADGEIYYEP